MHFVRLSGLAPVTKYSYTVQSGAVGSTESAEFTFQSAPLLGSTTRINIYGDMGVYTWNNMGNVLKDCQAGEADLIIHMYDLIFFV